MLWLEGRAGELESSLAAAREDLARSRDESLNLSDALEGEQAKNAEFAAQISDMSKTVGTLDKLSKTDPELLRKYSKVYFLNENYIPAKLSVLDGKWSYSAGKTLQIHASVLARAEQMLTDAKEQGKEILVVSAYRSFRDQTAIKSSYAMRFGSTAANSFSADQGYSEHQLGTTLDFTTVKTGASMAGFDKTEQYQWLMDNAYKYGFVLSYPKDNAYYKFEPWHWRFVGIKLARELHDRGMYFYDMDQREINTYLISIFG
jgi:D-alanyl-D-alanine carboxypeptidase